MAQEADADERNEAGVISNGVRARTQIADGNSGSRRIVLSKRNCGTNGVELAEIRGGVDVPAPAEHLVIMVNGIFGSAKNWEFAALKFREKFGPRVVIHCSVCNACTETLHGLDVMGRRLADEVREVINCYKGLRRISFVAHSLGGLIARYAIAVLYDHPDVDDVQDGREDTPVKNGIAGLEPLNFITVATPHLGCRGHGQLPFLFGIRFLEKLAVWIAPIFLRRTGAHLFLTDRKKNHPPLLRRMASDCDDGMFMSALKSFNRHVLYSNMKFDHVVGSRTSSLRRESEIPETKKHVPVDPKYPHVVSVEKVAPPQDVEVALKSPMPERKVAPASNPLEEEMIVALTRIPWERVDICFDSTQRLKAHSTIQVKSYSIHSEGADVIAHMIDNFLE